MSEITVRALSEDEWETYREVRLAALEESPDAFVASHDDEAAEPEQFWRDRMERSHRLLAEADGDKVGVVSIGGAPEESSPDVGQLFGNRLAGDSFRVGCHGVSPSCGWGRGRRCARPG